MIHPITLKSKLEFTQTVNLGIITRTPTKTHMRTWNVNRKTNFKMG